DGEHHERLELGRLLEDLLELLLETHAREQPDLHRLAELQRRRTHHALGGLAGGVADDHDRLHRGLYITSLRTREQLEKPLTLACVEPHAVAIAAVEPQLLAVSDRHRIAAGRARGRAPRPAGVEIASGAQDLLPLEPMIGVLAWNPFTTAAQT